MNHGGLFSGIGGFSLASEWCGWNNIFQVEIDKFCQKVLKKNFPEVERYTDIYEFDGSKYRGTIDIISGGFPCQPFSVAGKQKGKEDDRYLWPEMVRVIREIKPTWIVAENVIGIIGLALDKVLSDLEAENYIIQCYVIPACSVNASHRRDRVWIVANANGKRLQSSCGVLAKIYRQEKKIKYDVHCNYNNGWFNKNTIVEPTIYRKNHGISNRLHRLESLGNAIVPQVAYEIFKGIDKISNQTKG